jgi:hypothetical protein
MDKNRRIIAGAMSVAYGFPIEAVVDSIMVTLSAPDGRKFDVPMDIKIYEDVDEYKEISDEFWHEIRTMEDQPQGEDNGHD